MTYLPVTPFRRRMDAALLNHQKAQSAEGLTPVNKWEILRQLALARKGFDLSDRDLGVLRALLSFHPETDLTPGNLVVHPSNHAISERLNGMPLSTMRRHIARLVETGFLIRRDSPNGKRYLRRAVTGAQAFGFDLSPLLQRAPAIIATAEALQHQEAELAQLRLSVSLMRRDLLALADYGMRHDPALMNWDQLSDLAQLCGPLLRRKAAAEALSLAKAQLSEALAAIHRAYDSLKTEEVSTSPAPIEQHHQNSDKDSYESEKAVAEEAQAIVDRGFAEKPATALPSTPLPLVLSCCKELQNYAIEPIRSWHQLKQTAQSLPAMMGIPSEVWRKAQATLGMEEAAVVLASMLERFSEIRSPGAYLRALTTKALAGGFSSGPMLRALAHRQG